MEVSNDVLRRRFAASASEFVDKMEAGTGIRKRWYAPEDWNTSDLALAAARQALDRAGRKPEDLDLIILGTDSPDYLTPATSVVLQHKLGARNAGTFDVGCACASFPTGLAAAAGLIAANPALKTVLVVGAYLMHHHHWGIFSGGTSEPASESSVREGRTRVRMLERYPPEINEQGWPRIVRQLAEQGGFQVSDIDVSPIFTPLYHAGGLGAFLVPIFTAGGTIVLHRKFDAAEIWHAIEHWRCTVVLGVPTIWKLLLEAPQFATANLSHVRWFISGGAPLPLYIIEAYTKARRCL